MRSSIYPLARDHVIRDRICRIKLPILFGTLIDIWLYLQSGHENDREGRYSMKIKIYIYSTPTSVYVVHVDEHMLYNIYPSQGTRAKYSNNPNPKQTAKSRPIP